MSTSLAAAQPDSLAPLLNPEFIAKLDVEKTERLFALYEREQDRRASREFAESMTACQEQMPHVIKTNARNSHTGSNYAKQDAVVKALKPVYMQHGFTVSFGEEPCDREGFLVIVATVRHRAGHTETYRRFAPIDNLGPKGNAVKSILHGCQSSMSYMQRKLLESIFGIAESDDDDDGNGTVAKITREQADEIVAMLQQLPDWEKVRAGVIEWRAVDSLLDLPLADLELVRHEIRRKIASANKPKP
jgi:hypothetical protein